VGQQLLHLGPQTYVSGPEFRELFETVNRSMVEVMTEAQRWREEAMRSIPDAIFRSSADIVAELVRNRQEQAERLAKIERAIATMRPGAALAAIG
jgi:hypothetical protein